MNKCVCSRNQLDIEKNYKRKVRDILDAIGWICEKYESKNGCKCSSERSDVRVWQDEVNKLAHDIQEKNNGLMLRNRTIQKRRVETKAKPNRKFEQGYKRDIPRGYKRGPTQISKSGLKYHDLVPIGEEQSQHQNQNDGNRDESDYQRKVNPGIKRQCKGWARGKNIKNLTIQIENEKPVTDLSDKVEAMTL